MFYQWEEPKMRPEDFRIAHDMAQQLVRDGADPNEASKVLRYLATHQDGKRFFEYLETVVNNGFAVVRSNQTIQYYRDILAACDQCLRDYEDKPEQMAQVFGWAVRLMRFYRVAPKHVKPAKRTAETSTVKELSNLKPGMILEGTVEGIRPFGAFVDIGVGRNGLVHVSELAHGYVKNVSDVVNIGDRVRVKVLQVDVKKNRISLSMKDVSQASGDSGSKSDDTTTLGDVFGDILKKKGK